MSKSWKREVAGAVLVFVGVLAYKVFFLADEPEVLGNILMGLIPFTVVPCLAVFFADAYLKNKNGG
jgi:hypothetical protein